MASDIPLSPRSLQARAVYPVTGPTASREKQPYLDSEMREHLGHAGRVKGVKCGVFKPLCESVGQRLNGLGHIPERSDPIGLWATLVYMWVHSK